MKPIKLIMCGFGPYAERVEIDFTQFSDRTPVLIAGDTGAGKTTIFDGICFALYGTTSGTFRDTKYLRSEYASDSMVCYVEFYFEHQGNEYHIRREPAYERINRNGNKKVEPEKVVFYYPDATSVEGKSLVDGAKENPGIIKELLHVDSKQFMQIAMIAQGEFYNLLNAKTEKRTEILRTIFRTGGYKNMEYKLKDHMDERSKEKSEIEASILQYFGDVEVDANCEVAASLETLKSHSLEVKAVWNLEEILQVIEAAIDQETIQLQTAQQELGRVEKEYEENQKKLATAKVNNGFLDRLGQVSAEKKKLEEQKENMASLVQRLSQQKNATRVVKPVYDAWKNKVAEVQYTQESIKEKSEALTSASENAKLMGAQLLNAEAQKGEAEELQKRIDRIEAEQPKYQERDAIKKRLGELSENGVRLNQAEADISNKENELKEKIVELKGIVSSLENCPNRLLEVSADMERYEYLTASVRKILEEQVPERVLMVKALDQNRNAYRVARDAYDEILARKNDAERLLESARAGILASTLQEGQKCPVCGSIHHPDPAQLSENMITEAEFEMLKEAEQTKLAAKNDAFTQAEKAKAALDQFEENIRRETIRVFQNPLSGSSAEEGEELDILLSRLREFSNRLEEDFLKTKALMEQLENDNRVYKASLEALSQAQGRESENLARVKEELLVQKQENEKEEARLNAELKNVAELSYENLEMALEQRELLVSKVRELLDAITLADRNKKKADELVASIHAALETLQSTQEQQKSQEMELCNQVEKTLQEQQFANCEQMLSFVLSENELRSIELRVQEYEKAVSTVSAAFEQAVSDAEGRSYINVEELQAACDQFSNYVAELRRNCNTVHNRIDSNKQKRDNILKQRTDLETATKEYGIYSRLYNLVKGTINKTSKITLEQYIQATGFDGIIRAANRRLRPMSDDQYELFRQENSQGNKSNTFLDLEVLDNYTGRRRPVGNLSGGESFKASLSLALGLSDTVSSNIGGVQMDALFVDEGFGTLDKKSIESAMDILMNLSSANKLVGIISHREELIENIPQQIQVTKTVHGSEIKVELGA